MTQNLENFSRSKIQSWIKSGAVSVNNKMIETYNHYIKSGDNIYIQIPNTKENHEISPDKNVSFQILFEDSDILVINKPAGVVVHPGAGNYEHTLVNGLVYHCKENLSKLNTNLRPGIVHRIDKDTSGILVIAKNDYTHLNLAKQFECHSIKRKYICFIYGILQPNNGKIETLLQRDSRNRLRMAISQYSGKKAITIYKSLKMFETFASKVECELKTGRTHQIRAHLSNIGHSLIGDKLYKLKNYALPKKINNEINNFQRQALHAYMLEFIHPLSEKIMHFESELPDDMQKLEKILGNGVTT